MNKIIVFVGKRQMGGKECESYQMLANKGKGYLSREYSGEQEHEAFLTEVSEDFVEYLVKRGIAGQLAMANGFRINEEGNIERVGRLEASVFERFDVLLQKSITKFVQWGETVPIWEMN